MALPQPPQRIICLTEETTETLYLLGESDRIVGISGYTVRPAEARREKPRIAAYTTAKIDKILALEPDLVLAFSDLQADIVAALIKQGVEVHAFNQRTVEGIYRMIRTVGALVHNHDGASNLVARLRDRVRRIEDHAATFVKRPTIYFEEWDDPLISGIGWVSEIIELAGGIDCYAGNARHQGAAERIIADPADVIARNPDIIIGSWCGKRFRPEKVTARPGWDAINAVREDAMYEIKAPLILQPGPAALTDGLDAIVDIVENWVEAH